MLGLVGLRAAIELLTEIGVERIGRDLLQKRGFLVPALEAKGYSVLHGSTPAECASGIVTFFKPGEDMPALHARLEERKIIVSLRANREGQRFIRISPHFYNTQAELEKLIELL